MENLTDKYLNNIIKNNKISHAYLFTGNNEETIEEYIKMFVKSLFCLENIDRELFFCNSCKICKQIEHNNYVDFYSVNVENTIKKEDVLILKQEMSTKPTYSRKIYWIKNVDKMTPQASNSILKFLEEPEEKITALLTTTNLNAVLDTIISRCQIVNVVSEKKQSTENVVESQNYVDFFEMYKNNRTLAILELINSMENKEMAEQFIDYMLLKTRNSKSIHNKVNLLSILLEGKKDLTLNVNYNLVIESILFNIVKKDIELNE
ncbi:MAG: DNA polymerase III subunit delta' [Gemella sp.]|nr:DNA polymerase III subunit delta' [Gemella sp.]